MANVRMVLVLVLVTGVMVCPVSAGLVSHWKLDDGSGPTAADSADSNPGTVGSKASWSASGKIGGSSTFAGGTTGDCIVVPDDDSLDAASLTVSSWINTSVSENFKGIVEKGWEAGTNYGYVMQESTYYNGTYTTLEFMVKGSNGTFSATYYYFAADGGWHLVTGTLDSSSGDLKLYVDGDLKTTTENASYNASNKDLRIGGGGGATYAFDGSLDDVGVWNDALTGAEAKSLYSLANNVDLNYDLGLAQDLFDVHNAGGGSVAIDSLTWYYTASLTSALGEVTESGGEYYLKLDESGAGVSTIPEPATLCLLGFGGMAFLVRRRRRR